MECTAWAQLLVPCGDYIAELASCKAPPEFGMGMPALLAAWKASSEKSVVGADREAATRY